MTQPLDLTALHLAKGSHRDRSNGLCLLEAVAWWAGEPHTDRPACVSPVLAGFGRTLNDVLPDARRQELVRFVPLLPGTNRDGKDEARGYLALDWLIRTFAPAFLDLRPDLADTAAELRSLAPVVDLPTARTAGPVVRSARDKAHAAWDAARSAARSAAEVAARVAAEGAARSAARSALQPAVDALQASAIQLYAAMINPQVTR
jgi:hypothetical protein